MISDERAREIAREWHSPSPRDCAITALSHGVPYPLGDLALEAMLLMREHPQNMDVQALWRWVQEKQSRSTCPACRGEDPYEDHTVPGGCHLPENCPCGHSHDPVSADEEDDTLPCGCAADYCTHMEDGSATPEV